MNDKIIAALKMVFDPEIPVNVWDLGLIYDIKIMDDNAVNIQMTMTSPTCPMSEEILQMVRVAVGAVQDVKSVDVELVWSPAWDISRMTNAARIELDLTDGGW
ncbi:MAG: metal-sulfur cluster assembly factor [Rickettsiales bacterium]|jgi:FeS assembly SUF system protein|nr:metal-sulfur cluster assembly factor [Rickettsiales bacterium]